MLKVSYYLKGRLRMLADAASLNGKEKELLGATFQAAQYCHATKMLSYWQKLHEFSKH